jgi:phosphohistidine phosphatase
MSRALVVVRHAHAEWPAYVGRDFDRPLTPRGTQEATLAAQALLKSAPRPELVLVSPARRTRETAAIIADTLALPETLLVFEPSLYNASSDALEAAALKAFESRTTLMLIAHNPGVSTLARKLLADAQTPVLAPADWLICPV